MTTTLRPRARRPERSRQPVLPFSAARVAPKPQVLAAVPRPPAPAARHSQDSSLRRRVQRAVEVAGSCIMLLGFLVLAVFG